MNPRHAAEVTIRASSMEASALTDLLWKLKRPQLRELARRLGCPVGRSNIDTICNLVQHDHSSRIVLWMVVCTDE